MKKVLKGLLVGAGITAGAASLAALYQASLKKMMELALHREQPLEIDPERGRALISGSKEWSVAVGRIIDASGELEKREHETVSITAEDGIPLVGHWFTPAQPKRVILAMHGWRSAWSQDFGLIVDFWLQNDCAILFAEQRAQGSSGGDYMGFGLLERFDCRDWAVYLEQKTDGQLPLYLAGVSMGATTVLMASGLALPTAVRGILADCGFTSPAAIWKHVSERNLHLPYTLYHTAARELCKQKIQVGSDGYSSTEALANCTVPVLFIHGTDDHFVPIEMTYENYKACASKKRLLIVPGADHGLSYITDPEGYKKATRDFWQECEQE